ncbi:NADH-quinone oxidoreductase subunit J [Isoptericola variabilis]|uniref:NADH-quinone oxidoreductase subunit J n=1 Tax=Isoptericola variabilis (strain 225) TaxID=743718 RepID=F6FVA6_ISOV2|nr:NADH-quinone oxidoreductase subunit J [Isoptericola variabilis]AEG43379.1 NADH-ubiquinone/plastoquinone oxidoreductase chain 6 [Isoptericola variabilis 225]TWH34568.1 NADH-quinone oxidoreductase subunit J [Isoptericola variabilis J7]
MTASGGEALLFWVLAPLMVLAASGLLVVRKAVHAAICVMFVMVGLAILYVAQEAPFLGVVQVVVYTGAVMMLFLFVLMLVGVDAADSLTETIRGQRWIGLLLGAGLAAVLLTVIGRATFRPAVGLEAANAATNPVALARVLFEHYVVAMQVVGVLLVTAALAGLVLTHRRRLGPRVTQRTVARARVAALAEGKPLTPLPAPGVYAQNNAMDTPALGPDGRPLPHSVPRVLRIRGQERSATSVLAAEETLVERRAAREAERAELSAAAGTSGARGPAGTSGTAGEPEPFEPETPGGKEHR